MTGKEYSELRDELGHTQQQLAHLVGVSVSAIQAREQQPEKEVGSEAAIAIRSLLLEKAAQAEAE